MTVQDLRWARTEKLNRYFAKYGDTLDFIAAVHEVEFVVPELRGAWTSFHAWQPGFLEVDDGEVAMLEAGSPSASLLARFASQGWLDGHDASVAQLVQRTITTFPAIQNPVELQQFLEVVAELEPAVVVEIGTAAGGLLFCVAQLAAADGVIIAIDDPASPFEACTPTDDDALFARFGPQGQRLHVIRDRSGHRSTREDLERILEGRPIDLLIIDGDHSYGGVRSDYEMYRDLVDRAGIIAFHDICMRPETWGRGHDVGLFWDELSAAHPGARQLVDPNGSPNKPNFETPVGFEMPALGFGLLVGKGLYSA